MKSSLFYFLTKTKQIMKHDPNDKKEGTDEIVNPPAEETKPEQTSEQGSQSEESDKGE